MIIAAHPDDEVLGVGATMARLVREGYAVCVLIVAERVGLRHPGATPETVKSTTHAANRTLGVEDVRFGGFGGGGGLLDEVANRDLVGLIAGHLDDVQPDLLFTHHAGDVHVDHRAIARACRYCCRAGAVAAPRRLLSFEVPSSTEFCGPGGTAFDPTIFYDVEDVIALKIEAMRHYASELRAYPHPRSLEAISVLARFRGLCSNMRDAEAFQLIRERL